MVWDTLLLGCAPQGHSPVGHSRGTGFSTLQETWAGHSGDTLGLGSVYSKHSHARKLWALEGHFVVTVATSWVGH